MGERDRRSNPPDTGVGTDQPVARKGNTTVAQGEDQQAAPRMPHERDESADQQPTVEPSNARVGRAAQADVQRGVADTTKGAELDATYDKLRENVPDGEKKFRR
jgi:hypothetical protein